MAIGQGRLPKVGIRLRFIRGDLELVAAITEEADRLGFESVWIGDRLVVPLDMLEKLDKVHASLGQPPELGSPHFDQFVYLAFLAGRTEHIRFGTAIYLMGLRHPFVVARAIQTLDIVSRGRSEIGIGAGWLSSEFEAMDLDFSSRARRLDEVIAVCQKLWADPVVEHHGEFFDFAPVKFEPKPIQKPWPPMHVGGEEMPSLKRAARLGGWIGRSHTIESVRPIVKALRELRTATGLDEQIEVTVRPPVEAVTDLAAWGEAGVTRLAIIPWEEGEDPIIGMRNFAATRGLVPPD